MEPEVAVDENNEGIAVRRSTLNRLPPSGLLDRMWNSSDHAKYTQEMRHAA